MAGAILVGRDVSVPGNAETLSETLVRAGREFPAHGITFVDSAGTETFVSYPGLIETARRQLHALQQRGLKPGDTVILAIDEPKDFYGVFWACVFGGIVPVPITQPASLGADDPDHHKLATVWQALDRPTIVVNERSQQWSESLRASPLLPGARVCHSRALDSSQLADIHRTTPDDLVILQYSSGSTGGPKGVMLTNRNVFVSSLAICGGAAITSRDVVCNWLPHTHDMALIGQHVAPMFAGANILRLTPATFIRAPLLCVRKIGEHKASLFCCPNFGLDWLNRHVADTDLDGLDVSSLRVVFNGAEPISAAVMTRFIEKFAKAGFRAHAMFPVYGMAEATLAVSFPPLGSLPKVVRISRAHLMANGTVVRSVDEVGAAAIDVVSEGQPVAGMAIRIADEAGAVLREDMVGEIQIQGPSVASGYYKNAGANASSFCDGWFRTGDVGFVSDGHLFVSGRLKDIVFVRGRNYYSHDIEELLYSVERVQRGGLAVIGSFNHAAQAEELIVFVKHKGELSRFMALRNVIVERLWASLGLDAQVLPVARIPKTTSGKIQRFVLRRRYDNGDFDRAIQDIDRLIPDPAPRSNLTRAETDSQRRLISIWSRVLGIDEREIGIDSEFRALGGDSVRALQLLGALDALAGVELGHDVLVRCKTIRELDRWLTVAREPRQPATPARPADQDPAVHRERDIAITGVAVRFPCGDTQEAFWDSLCREESWIAPVSAKRRALAQCDGWDDSMGELRDVECFDHAFFDVSAEDAKYMDPQQRILLEMSYQCLEDAGLSAQLDEEAAIGVYVGISTNSYAELLIKRLHSDGLGGIHQNAMVGNLVNMIAARISHMFNFTGPSMSIDTACSSFMVALAEGVHALRAKKVSGALVASSNLMLTPTTHLLAGKAGILSKTNRCKVFDREADGAMLGEGAVVVFLEPLADAVRNGKHVYGVIKGVAVNNDGYSLGLMAPNPRGQLAVLREAYQDAGVNPSEVSYIEAHGTGTPLGDPVELRALSNLFKESGAKNRCGIGSVKSNVGHLLHAAGGAGLAKVLLCLANQARVPTAGLECLNPSLEIEKSPFYVVRTVEHWEVEPGHMRKAGVSAFGFGGTNAHVVLEEYDTPAPDASSADDAPFHLLTFSASSERSLQALIDASLKWTAVHPEVRASDLCYTRNRCRRHWAHRAAFVFSHVPQLTGGLSTVDDTVVSLRGHFDKKRPARTVVVAGADDQPSVDTLRSMGLVIDAVVAMTDSAGMPSVAPLKPDTVVVLGGSPDQVAFLEESAKNLGAHLVIPTRSRDGVSRPTLLSVIANVYVHGGRVAWDTFSPGQGRQLVRLPSYPFDRSASWIELGQPSYQLGL